MHLERKQWLMLGLLVMGLVASTSYSQRGGMPTPEETFSRLSKNASSFVVDKVEIPPEMTWREPADKQKAGMKEFLEKKGVKDGTMTLLLYKDYTATRMAGFTFGMMANGGDTIDVNRLTPSRMLSEERIGQMKAALEKKGIKDGKMTLEVYTELTRARMDEPREDRKGKDETKPRVTMSNTPPTTGGSADDKSGARTAPVVKIPEPTLDSRPIVFRYGKLPTRDLPSWFIDMDKDKDGQIGLYEWRSAGKERVEFKKYDMNTDGFITAEEMISVQRVEDSKDTKDSKALTFARLNADPGSPDGLPTPPPGTVVAKGDKGSYKGGDYKGGGDKGGGDKGADFRAKMMEKFGKRGDKADKTDKTDKTESDKRSKKGKSRD